MPRSVFGNTVALFAARVCSRGGSILLVFWLSRMLQADGLGSYSTAMALFGLGELACELGLSHFLPRELAKDLARTNRYLVHASTLVIAGALISVIVLVVLVPNLGYSTDTVISVYLISLALVPTALGVVIEAVFVSHQKAQFVAYPSLLWTVVRIATSLYLLHRGHGVISVVAVFTVTGYCWFLTNVLLYTRCIGRLRWEFDRHFLTSLIRELRTFVALAVGGSAFSQAETVILSVVAGEREVGLYSAALKLITVWYIIPQSYLAVIFPLLTRAYQRYPQKAQVIQEKSVRYLLAVALPLAVGGFAAAQPIVHAVYGPGFDRSIAVFRVISWHTILSFVNGVLWRVLLARDEQHLALRVQVISGTVRMVLALVLGLWLGSLGAALALMGGYIVYTVLHTWYLRKGGSQLRLAALGWRFGVAAAVMGAFTYMLAGRLHLFVLVVSAGLVYGILVLLLGGLSRDDLVLFRQIWNTRGVGASSSAEMAAVEE